MLLLGDLWQYCDFGRVFANTRERLTDKDLPWIAYIELSYDVPPMNPNPTCVPSSDR
jgi:hypothetical protein